MRFLMLIVTLSFAAPALAQAPPPKVTEHRTLPPIKKTQGPQFGLLNIGVGGGFRGRLESQQREIDQLRQQLNQQQMQPAPQPLQAPGPSYDPAVAAELRRIGDMLQQQILLQQSKPVDPGPGPIAQLPPAPINIYIPRQELPISGAPKQDLPIAGPPRQDLPIAGPPRQDLPIAGPPRQELPIQGAPKQELPPGGIIKQEIQIPIAPAPPRQELPSLPAPPRQELGPPTGYQRFSIDRNARWVPNVWHPVEPRVTVYDRRY